MLQLFNAINLNTNIVPRDSYRDFPTFYTPYKKQGFILMMTYTWYLIVHGNHHTKHPSKLACHHADKIIFCHASHLGHLSEDTHLSHQLLHNRYYSSSFSEALVGHIPGSSLCANENITIHSLKANVLNIRVNPAISLPRHGLWSERGCYQEDILSLKATGKEIKGSLGIVRSSPTPQI